MISSAYRNQLMVTSLVAVSCLNAQALLPVQCCTASLADMLFDPVNKVVLGIAYAVDVCYKTQQYFSNRKQ